MLTQASAIVLIARMESLQQMELDLVPNVMLEDSKTNFHVLIALLENSVQKALLA